MKNLITKALLLLLVLFVGISLTACSEEETDTYNKNVSYGNISNNVYAKIGDLTITEKQLYDELRVSGYDYLFDEIINILIADEKAKLNITTNRQELIDLINNDCYGTSDTAEIERLTSTTKKASELKYIDQMSMANVKIAQDDLYNDEILTYYLTKLAQRNYAKNLITSESSKYYWGNEFQTENNETLKDENGKELSNPYYISDETVEYTYNNEENSNATYNVVIVGFDTLAESKAAIATALADGTISFEEAKAIYTQKYTYKNVTDAYFLLKDEDLSDYNSNLISLVKNLKAGEYKVNQQFGNKVYLVYLNAEKVEADYAALDETTKATVKAETVKEIIEDKLTSSTISNLLVEEVYESNIEIHDYVYDVLYSVENPDHVRLDQGKWNNNLVATVNGKEITVDTFYSVLESKLGVTTAMDYFTSLILLNNNEINSLTDKEIEAINTNYNEIMSSFEQDGFATSNLPASIGKDVFTFIYFGQKDEASVKEYLKSQKIWQKYTTTKPNDEYYKLVEKVGKVYDENYFDLSVKHILLTADFNDDGNPDDPETYLKDLPEAKRADFYNQVKATFNVILAEVHAIMDAGYADLVNALDHISKAYYSNSELVSQPGKYWNEFKTVYNFGLKIEDLGSVNNSTVSKYVSEFGVGVKALYNQLKADGKLNTDYLATTAEDKDIIKTSFGYHMLASYDTTSAPSAKFEAEDDKVANPVYTNIKLEIDGEEVVVENIYNSNTYPSYNQIKVYVSQLSTEAGVEDLPMSVETYINKFYTSFTSAYNNETFKNILLAKTELTIDFTNNENDEKYENFLTIQVNQYNSYTDPSESTNFLAGLLDIVLGE